MAPGKCGKLLVGRILAGLTMAPPVLIFGSENICKL